MQEFYKNLESLKNNFKGEIFHDQINCLLYATDASAYRELPLAVVFPKSKEDIQTIIKFARDNRTSLIPRTAGTSLAGQVVGGGIVVDVSKYLTKIIEINEQEHWVKVEPGVVLDELNKILAPKNLFFGPETSTSSRCMIGGMVGNNSCGAHSIIYGSTRDHLMEVNTILSDGSEVVFKALNQHEFIAKTKGELLENKIYQNIQQILSNPINQEEIRTEYPDKSIKRRNTGYAIDLLLETEPFVDNGEPFNFCKLIAGSEGTLAFITEIKLHLVPVPPKEKALICVHTHTLKEALLGNLIALKHQPTSIELMDDVILELTKDNIEQNKNRFFVEGKPGAILIVEFSKETKDEIITLAKELETDMRNAGYGYHFPVVFGADMKKVWDLRKAGLGVLSNMPGDAKPVPVIEDTAVNPEVLPDYIEEFQELLTKYHLSCVYYAHIATGEIHLRPILNLKDPKDVELFHTIAFETAKLVKKYKGSLSGEHGDGRLRGEFIPLMIGDQNYALLKQIKACWDPENIFNPKKIVDTPKMNTSLRFEPGKAISEIKTIFNFSHDQGILRAIEKCNGSADCRKTEIIGGTMCPSYMASRNESQTTRARANILREFLSNSKKENPFDHKEIYQIMDLCLSCKACKSECPSSVDIAKLKAEFLQHYYDSNGIPLRTRAIAYITSINQLGSILPSVNNFFMKNKFTSGLAKKILGFAPNRSIPLLHNQTLASYVRNLKPKHGTIGKVYLFNDEFTNYNDTSIGIKAILLLNKLGYEVIIPKHISSGRTFISKGLIRTAQKIANKNINFLKDLISEETPLIGIEPSAILSFRDEYPDLAYPYLIEASQKIAKNALMIDEFLAKEVDLGRITKEQFTKEPLNVLLHGHCQQKSIASTMQAKKILSLPENYHVNEIPSGCCGMAGSFGYEKEHYDLSMKIGELVLFPTIRKANKNTVIAAPGTSCRHQIKDGTQKTALHPVEILWEAINK